MVVGKKVERLHVGVLAGLNGRLNCPDIIAEVRGAGCGDAGKDAGFTEFTHTNGLNHAAWRK